MFTKNFGFALAAALAIASSALFATRSVSVTDSISFAVSPLDGTTLAGNSYLSGGATYRDLIYSAGNYGTSTSVLSRSSGNLSYGIADLNATPTGESLSLNVPSVSPPAGYVDADRPLPRR